MIELGKVFAGGPDAVVLFHGLSSSPLELQIVARGLSRAGHTVYLPEIPGFSHDPAQPVRPDSRRWIDDAHSVFDRLARSHRRIAVGGLCIGAVLALHLAARSGRSPSAVLALSTTLHYDGWSLPWYRHLLPLAAWLPFGRRYNFRERTPFGVKDERTRKWIEQQMAEGLSDAESPALSAPHLMEARRLIRRTRPLLSRVTAPTLVVHALEDEVASPRSAEEVVRGVGSAQTRYVLLRDSYHMLSIDREKHRVITEMSQFLQQLETGPHEPPRDGTAGALAMA